jgi:hypothetical protein
VCKTPRTPLKSGGFSGKGNFVTICKLSLILIPSDDQREVALSPTFVASCLLSGILAAPLPLSPAPYTLDPPLAHTHEHLGVSSSEEGSEGHITGGSDPCGVTLGAPFAATGLILAWVVPKWPIRSPLVLL